mmetsp:Transcript_26020/g.63550  ORF Transcript_26020/g.63550 Transcript_26020/m.63550 type:complete len:145 (+) Transcript_26020:227-661(+)
MFVADAGLDQWMMLSGDDCTHQVQPPSASIPPVGAIYRLGIPIPPTETRRSKTISRVLIFNSALAHHLSAETSATPARMIKAKLLYQLVYDPADKAISPLFQFVVINNLGVIERSMGNASVSNQYFDLLLPILLDLLEDQKVME